MQHAFRGWDMDSAVRMLVFRIGEAVTLSSLRTHCTYGDGGYDVLLDE